jgi:hypothetical protein
MIMAQSKQLEGQPEIDGWRVDCMSELRRMFMNNSMTEKLTEKLSAEATGLAANLQGAAAKLDGAIDAGKAKLASGMEHGAEKLLAGALAVEEGVMGAAGTLGDGAAYLRDARPSQLLTDARVMVRKYPVQSAVACLLAGVLVGHAIWAQRSTPAKY